MKTIFTLGSGLLMSIALMATPSKFDWKTKSMLTIRSAGQGNIRVVVDGKKFDPRHNTIAIRNVQTGYHNLKIYRQRNIGLFEKFRNRYELVFNKSVMIRNNTNLVITIDRFGRPNIDQQKLKGKGKNYKEYKNRDNDRDFDRNKEFDNDREFDRDRNFEWENDDDLNRKSGDGEFEFDFDRDGNKGDFDNDYGYEYENRNSKSMSEREFSNVLQSIQKEWFEGNKIKTASQIISGNYFSSTQVKQMLQLFSFENNKLDLAKQAYSKTVDPGNYMMMVSDVFGFNSSRDELARFIRGTR